MSTASHRRIVSVAATCVILVVALAPVARSQDRWSWPDTPKNLQVFPKEWTGQRLRPVMLGFTNALGVRCSHCHVGEEGKPLSTFDFASDANPNKDRAREMYRMLGSINAHLEKITPGGDKRVNMWCHTCHDGRPRPATLPEELGARYRMGGVDSALAHYADLKKRFYGRGGYDFGEGALNEFGYDVLAEKDFPAAIRVFAANAELHPQSPNAWDSLAEAWLKSGDTTRAAEYYRKVLTLDPGNANATKMLDQTGRKK